VKKAVFLQCRLDSSRLPGKALLPLKDKTIVEHAMVALKEIPVDDYVLLTTMDSVNKLTPLAEKCGFQVFAGPKEDVLLRFLQAAKEFNVKRIIRATADNPLVSAKLAVDILQNHIDCHADYSGYIGIPIGTGVEILEQKALIKANADSNDPYDHEHVAPYLYRNPDIFKVNRPDVNDQWGDPGLKVSVDTNQDYLFIKKIFEELYHGDPIELNSLMPFLEKAAHE